MNGFERFARLEGVGSFAIRGLALLAFAFVVSTLDFARHRRSATRWREYALLLLAAAAGAACGAVCDAVTSTVSPDYFVVAKGIDPGPGFRARAVALGAQAGAGFGALLGGGLMFAAGRGFTRDPAAVRRIVRACFVVPFCGLTAGAAALFVSSISRTTLAWFREWSWLTEDEMHRATVAWLGHLGVYVGALAATVVVIRELRKLGASRE